MSKKWIDGKYGFSNLKVGLFTVTVGWDSMGPRDLSGYKVSFESVSLPKRFQNCNEAKVAGETLAKKYLEQALKELAADV